MKNRVERWVELGVLKRFRGGLRRVGALRIGEGRDLADDLKRTGYKITSSTMSNSGEIMPNFARAKKS